MGKIFRKGEKAFDEEGEVKAVEKAEDGRQRASMFRTLREADATEGDSDPS
ncbi:MAG: hypothetical protein WA919_01950 [Coleofasciculaceae cyanobacterium]